MNKRTVLVPLLLPRLSDRAAAHLIDIVEQLMGIVQHHYGDQAHRWRRRQRPPPTAADRLAPRLTDDLF